MNNNIRENEVRRAHLLFLIINAVFSVLLVLRIIRTPEWEKWFIPVLFVMAVSIWIIYFRNMFSLRARTIIITGTSLVFLFFYGVHYEVFFYEFPLCMGFFVTACAALDEITVTIAGISGYFVTLFYHIIVMQDSSVVFQNYLSIIVMITVFFYSRFLIGKHSQEVRAFDEGIKKMEEERKSREDFLANVSHELRTPVNAIAGMTDILLKKDLEEEVREEILTIERAGIRLSNQIDDILDFSEIISGSLINENESYFFSDFIRDMKAIGSDVDEENKNIIWNIENNIPAVLFGDQKKIKHVFNNILKNALKQSGANVYVGISARSEDYGINLSISVKDEGQGIKQEDIDRAYYGRFEGSNKNNRQEGLKLGLSISNGLTRFMNGFMIFDSRPGEGTTVTITIPQKVIDPEPWGKDGLRVQEEAVVLDLTGRKILVVDDDHMNLGVAKKMLSAYGGEIKTVDSGYSAIEICNSEEFSIIFMDHMMPGMDGIETYRTIKTGHTSKNRDTVFIALTANAVSGAKEMFLSEGFADFISKPIDRKALEQTIFGIEKSLGAKQETKEIKEEPESVESKETLEILEKETDQPAEENDKLKILKDFGVNTVDALTYCAGSEDFYFMMLSDFAGQIEDKITELSGYMNDSDEDNYRIKIHALKSNTKTLGFDEVSEMARLSEMACKEGRFIEAQNSHEGIMEKLREIGNIIDRIK